MKDVTTTSFGLLIAYLLPGFAALYSLSFWVVQIDQLFAQFAQAKTTFGLFLLVILFALVIGLLLNAVRWKIYEQHVLASDQLSQADFVALSAENRLFAFHTAIDENFRYHQFYGGLTLVIPVLAVGVIKKLIDDGNWTSIEASVVGFLVAIFFLVVEVIAIETTLESYRRFILRARSILEVKANAECAQRKEKDEEKGDQAKGEEKGDQAKGEEKGDQAKGEEKSD